MGKLIDSWTRHFLAQKPIAIRANGGPIGMKTIVIPRDRNILRHDAGSIEVALENTPCNKTRLWCIEVKTAVAVVKMDVHPLNHVHGVGVDPFFPQD